MSYSINSVSTTRAEKAAGDLNALISQCRVETLSGAPSPRISSYTRKAMDCMARCTRVVLKKTAQKLGGSDISCTFDVDSGDPTSVSQTQPLCLAFDRSTGACMKLGDIIDGGSQLNSGVTGDYCTAIRVASNGAAAV